MSGSRTERPTPRRLRDARKRGEVPVSRELTGAVALLAGLAAAALLGPGAAAALAAGLRRGLSAATGGDVEPLEAAREALRAVAEGALPVCAVAFAAAAVAGAIQTGGLVSVEAFSPRLGRLDPWKGLKHLASATQLARAAAGLVKTFLALALGWRRLAKVASALAQAPRLEPRALLSLAGPPLLALALELSALLVAFGALDLLLVRRRFRGLLMMTPDEVQRERREEEGDPRHKAERRRLHRALASAGPVSRAAVVVVNPTRLAVALGHRPEADEPPVVLAKGTGDDAARIRALARRAGVPIVRDVALARALYQLAEVGEEIPAELYRAAAVVLARVYGLADGEPRA